MLGVCNAAFKKLYGESGDNSAAQAVTPEVIQQQVYPDKSLQEVRRIWAAVLTLLRNAGAQGLGVRAFQPVVARSKLSNEDKKIIVRFWEGKWAAAHRVLEERSRLGPSLRYIDWRVDVHASSRGAEEESKNSQPSAVLQVLTSDLPEPVVFEVSKSQLDTMVDQLAQIENALTKNE